MQQIILMVHVLLSIAIIALVLIQHGKGADAGAAFGSGASNTMFGSRGSGSFLVKVTGTLCALFLITSLTLGYLANEQYKAQKAQANTPVVQQQKAPISKVPAKNSVPAVPVNKK